jgi:hypothetical protein
MCGFYHMPVEPYVSVTLKRDVVNTLAGVGDSDASVSAKVTEAIQEYVRTRGASVSNQTPEVSFMRLDGTSTPP